MFGTIIMLIAISAGLLVMLESLVQRRTVVLDLADPQHHATDDDPLAPHLRRKLIETTRANAKRK
jgi:hypothetical protein